jgi:hypothetical protein
MFTLGASPSTSKNKSPVATTGKEYTRTDDELPAPRRTLRQIRRKGAVKRRTIFRDATTLRAVPGRTGTGFNTHATVAEFARIQPI